MDRSWLIRAAAAGAGGMLVMGVAMPLTVAMTEASWMHTQSAQTSLTATTAPAPVNVKGAYTNTHLGGPVATIAWSAPASVNGSVTTYVVVGKQNASDVEWKKIADAPGNSYAFGNGLLGGLIGDILNLLFGGGNEITVGVIAIHMFTGGAVWKSVPG